LRATVLVYLYLEMVVLVVALARQILQLYCNYGRKCPPELGFGKKRPLPPETFLYVREKLVGIKSRAYTKINIIN
jgi:hypothetical protein